MQDYTAPAVKHFDQFAIFPADPVDPCPGILRCSMARRAGNATIRTHSDGTPTHTIAAIICLRLGRSQNEDTKN